MRSGTFTRYLIIVVGISLEEIKLFLLTILSGRHRKRNIIMPIKRARFAVCSDKDHPTQEVRNRNKNPADHTHRCVLKVV